MAIALKEIFIDQQEEGVYKKQDLFALKVNPNFLEIMTAHLNLSYLEGGSKEENTCFVNNIEIRPECRIYFSKIDLIHYVTSFLTKDTFDLQKATVPIPENENMFWAFANAKRGSWVDSIGKI